MSRAIITSSRTMIAIALLLATAAGAAAQTAEEIVERHLAALGGRAALERLTSRTRIGFISVSTLLGDLNGPIEATSAVPNKSRILISFDLGAGGGKETYDERFDGASGHIDNTLDSNREISGNELHNLRNEAFPTPLLDHRGQGASLVLSGKEQIGDREAYVLTLTPKTGPAMKRFIDVESYLEIRTVMTSDDPVRGAFEMTTDFSDYRDVDGIKVAFQITGHSVTRNFTATLTAVTHNQPTDAAIFSRPATETEPSP